ncbi:hypothetical protein LFM09_49735 [Lentzea alba]|uniref:hypothetical protein n=1 Tax=Lentzea alba TaxID=2714351 RepID=UPI0039BF25E3
MRNRLLAIFKVARVTSVAALVAALAVIGAGSASALESRGYCDGGDGSSYSRIEFTLNTDSAGVQGFSFALNPRLYDIKLGDRSNVDMSVYGRNTSGQVVKLGQTWYSGDDIKNKQWYNISYRISRPGNVKEAWAVFHAIFDRPRLYDFQCWGETTHRVWL